MKEIYKPITDFEEKYEISNYGNVRSLLTNNLLSPGNNGTGYLFVNLYRDNKAYRIYIHRLVALHFLDTTLEYDDKFQVNHLDGNKQHNCYSNLEVTDQSENIKHSYRLGLHKAGEKHHNSKITDEDKLKALNEYGNTKWTGMAKIAKKYNITYTAFNRHVYSYIAKHPEDVLSNNLKSKLSNNLKRN